MKLPLTLYGHARICAILFWLGVAIVVIGGIFSEPPNPHWLMWIGVVVFLSSFGYRLLYIHCPHCNDLWAGMPAIPEYCPKCGKKIE